MPLPFPALLLAAGVGTRLAPLTNHIPKCLVPIHGKPLLAYWLDMLGEAGITPLVVNTHHHAAAVEEFVASSPWKKNVVLAYEEKLLGTGGTLLANKARLGDGAFMVIHADNLSRFNVADFVAAHRNRPDGCILTMMLFRTPTPRSCGIVSLDSRGVVTEFHEKSPNPPGDLANAAVYIMEPDVFDILSATNLPAPDISLDLIPRCMGRIGAWLNADYHRDIGTPESYAAAQREFPPQNT